MLYPVQDADSLHRRHANRPERRRFDIHAKVESINWQFIVQRAFEEVDADAAMIERGNWQSENVEVFKGRGRFTGLKAVTVEGFSGGFGGPYPAGGRRPGCGLHHLHL